MKMKLFVLLFSLMVIMACSAHKSSTKQEEKALEYVNSLFWSKMVDVAIDGNYAYCAYRNGLIVMDVTQKNKPVVVSQLYLGGGSDIDLKPGLAFIAAKKKGLLVVDISNPKEPVLKASLDTPGEAVEVALKGNYAYIADWTSGLQIVDIHNPLAPEIPGTFDTPGSASGRGWAGSASGSAG